MARHGSDFRILKTTAVTSFPLIPCEIKDWPFSFQSPLVNFDGAKDDNVEPQGGKEANCAGEEEDSKRNYGHVAKVEKVGDWEIRFKLGEVE